MRLVFAFLLAISTASAGLFLPPTADGPDVAGAWKLVLMQFGEDEFVIFDLKTPVDGKLTGPIVNANTMLGPIKPAEGTLDGDLIAVQFPGQGEPLSFKGALDPGGKLARGSVRYRGTTYPGRIERTESKSVAKLGNSTMPQKLAQAQALKDPKAKLAKILGLIEENPGHPMNAPSYVALMGLAESAGLSTEEVAKLAGKWVDEARPFGPGFVVDTQSRALKSLQGKKPYATLATEMALAADKALPADAPMETRGNVVTMLARSARLAGNLDLATEADARAKVIDDKLDAEFHHNVPPFKPETFAGRPEGQDKEKDKDKDKANRVVLMEIFTGAECPPCVAADVAFDALLKTYQPTEFIGLQHHLHIPGPDPLTNLDTEARQRYYGALVRGTPSTFFNGKSLAGGGGGMANSEGKYREFRGLIDPMLAAEKQADIKLTATRSGDEVKIVASASTSGGTKDARPRLRLVLVEPEVRYPGGNKLRFHANVVRAFPGGVEGKALERGEGLMEVTVKLNDLRKAQDDYLAQYPNNNPRGRAFPNALPPMDLNELAVVAFVQDDADQDDHAVWHAIQVPVKGETH